MTGVPTTIWLFVGVVALLWSAGAFLPFDRPTRVVLAIGATVWWWVWAIHSTAVDVWSHGTVTEYAFRELLILGTITGVIMLLVGVWHAFRLLNPEDEESTNPADQFQQNNPGGR